MRVSATLIVRDEEATLRRCLASLAGAIDDLVVVDTGSSDRTKAIAVECGARVYDFAWIDDFAAARQFALERADGDWVFWVDADDVVVGAEHIRDLCRQAPDGLSGYYWRYVLGRDDRGLPTFEYWRERCVRNDGSSRWSGRVHETLVVGRPNAMARTERVVVEHHPRPWSERDRYRNLRILEAECAADAPEPRSLFYLGREYSDLGDRDRAIDALRRYLAVGTWSDERYAACMLMATLERGRGNEEASLDAAWAAIKIHPRWPDAYFHLAAGAYFRSDWPTVIHWADIGRSLAPPDTLLFIDPRNYSLNWIIHYTNALYHAGRVSDALEWTHRALAVEPANVWHQQNARFFSTVSAAAAASPRSPAHT